MQLLILLYKSCTMHSCRHCHLLLFGGAARKGKATHMHRLASPHSRLTVQAHTNIGAELFDIWYKKAWSCTACRCSRAPASVPAWGKPLRPRHRTANAGSHAGMHLHLTRKIVKPWHKATFPLKPDHVSTCFLSVLAPEQPCWRHSLACMIAVGLRVSHDRCTGYPSAYGNRRPSHSMWPAAEGRGQKLVTCTAALLSCPLAHLFRDHN